MNAAKESAPTLPGRGAGYANGSWHADVVTAEPLLQRLDGVQKAGKGWRARCPACGGKSRKLSITECDNKVLVTCFDCHDTPAVLAAVGLSFADLFPPRHWPETPKERAAARKLAREGAQRAALSVLAFEARIVQLAAAQIAADIPLEWDDYMRLVAACERIDKAHLELTEVNP